MRRRRGRAALIGPTVQHLRDELRAVVHTNEARCTAPGSNRLHGLHHMLTTDAAVHHDRQRLARVVVDQRQGTDPTPVEKRVGDEVHRPLLVRPRCHWPLASALCHDVPPGPLVPEAQPLLPVQPVDTSPVHRPAFAAEQDVDAWVAVADPHRGNLTDP